MTAERPMAGETDPVLVERYLVQGDPEAFRELVLRYERMVYGVCLRCMGGDHTLVQDAAQVTFVVLSKKVAGMKDFTSLGGWLHRTARFVAMDMWRSRSRIAQREQALTEEHLESHAVEPEAPFNEAWWADSKVHLDAAMADLPPKFQEVLVMHYFQELSLEGIASALQCPMETVRTRLRRGRDTLRQRMARKAPWMTAAFLLAGLRAEAATTAPPAGFADACLAAALSGAGGGGTVAVTADAIVAKLAAAETTASLLRVGAGLLLAAVLAALGVAVYRTMPGQPGRGRDPAIPVVAPSPPPGPGTVLRTIPLPPPQRGQLSDVAWDGTSLWVFAGRMQAVTGTTAVAGTAPTVLYFPVLQRLDPNTGTELSILRTYGAEESICPAGLESDGTWLWISDWASHRLHAVDPGSGRVVKTLDSPSAAIHRRNGATPEPVNNLNTVTVASRSGPLTPTGLACGEGRLWILDDLEGAFLHEVELEQGEILHSFAVLPEYTGETRIECMAYWDGSLWLVSRGAGGGKGRLLKVNPETGDVDLTIEAPCARAQGVAADGQGHLWISDRATKQLFLVALPTAGAPHAQGTASKVSSGISRNSPYGLDYKRLVEPCLRL